MTEKKEKNRRWIAYLLSVFLSSMIIIASTTFFNPDWYQNFLPYIFLISPLILVLSIFLYDFYEYSDFIRKFIKKCCQTFLRKGESGENKILKSYYIFTRYLAIYAFLGYQIIFYKHLLAYLVEGLPINKFTGTNWTLLLISIWALLFLWRPPIPKEKLVERAIFFAVILFIIPLIVVAIAELDLEILFVGALFGGMLIWIDSLYISSNFILPEFLNRVMMQAEKAPSKIELILEQLYARKKHEAMKMRTVVTLYSAACIGIFVRLIDFNNMKVKNGDFFLWGIVLVVYISLGWAKSLLFQSRKNWMSVQEYIEKTIDVNVMNEDK